MQNTENFDLKIYEGEDLFNPLVVENTNMRSIDTQLKKNENHTVGDATELVSGTVHALTRLTPDTPMLRFTATSRFTAGDTFTVDGVQVSALTVSGEQLPDGAYIIGSEVLAYLKGTLLTFFTSQGTLATAQNALKLGGKTPEYYATATAVQQAQDTATAAGNLANKVNSNLINLGSGYLEPSPISGTYGSANSMFANTIRVHRLALIQLRGNFTGVSDIPLTSLGLHDNDRNVGSYSLNGEIIAKGVGSTNSENTLFVRVFPQNDALQISATSPDLYEVLIPLCINE